MIKKLLLIPILLGWAFAQSPHVDTMDYCGLGHHKDKPCRCVDHTNQIQNDWVFRCLGEHPSWDETRCVREMPQEVKDHCQAIEHYGNWGDESHPMPQQCSMACRRGHCKCQDGPMCHIGHQPEEDGK